MAGHDRWATGEGDLRMNAIARQLGLIIGLGLGVGSATFGGIAFAQVIPDGTLPTTVTSPNNLNFAIDGGSRSGNNLFHSFGQFSVPTGGSAVFNNAADIQTIFSRVTGGNLSNIDGLIQANGTANLFLLNPSGILFGPNASLNIGGSFIGTTANSIKFADGVEFSAVNANGTPLLTMSVPIGLQMGQNSGNITVQGTGHRISPVGSLTPLNFNNTPAGLSVATGRTLALLGGNIQLNSGILSAPGGNLELGAVQPTTPTIVGLRSVGDRWIFDYGTLQQFGDITMQQQALGNISNAVGSTHSGGMQIRARNLIVEDGSALVWENRGSQAGSGISIQTSESIQFLRQSQSRFRSGIYSDARGAGSPGDVSLSTPLFRAQEGTTLSFRTFSTAAGSNVTINAADVQQITTTANINSIATRTLGSGRGGNLTVNTQRLINQGGGGILATIHNAPGAGGNLTINASESVELISGVNGIPTQTFLSSGGLGGTGNNGNLTVNTGKLVMRNGAAIASSTINGKGGVVTINASEGIDMSGTRTDPLNGFLRTSIQAQGIDPMPSARAFFGLTGPATGQSGSVTINTPQIRVADGALITVTHENSGGNAGNLWINAGRLTLENQGRIEANTKSGEGGNITLNVQELLSLRHGGFISAQAGGIGNGGNITINSPIILGLENSDIIANAVQGRGGNITITTQGIIGLAFRNTLTPRTDPTNDITASSQFNVNGTVQINNIGVDPNSGLVELPVDLSDPSQQIAKGCAANQGSSFVVTGRGGVPLNPMEQVRSDRPWTDTRDLSALRAGAPTVPAPAPTDLTAAPLVQATGWRRNPQTGKVELYADTIATAASTAAATCAGVTP
jgi:filamentous hemagglutinin family protein